MIQAMFRCNMTVYTMAFLLPMLDSALHGPVLLCTTLVTVFFNLPSVAVFTAFQKNAVSLRHRLVRIFTTPCVIAGVLGLGLMASGLPTVPWLGDVTDVFREICNWFGFLCVGASLYTQSGANSVNRPLVMRGLLLRFLVLPVIGLSVAVLLGFRGAWLFILCPLFAGPCTGNGHAIALEMGGDGALSGALVFWTQLLAPFVLFCYMSLLSLLGFM